MAGRHTETIDSKLKTAWQTVSRMYNAQAVEHDATLAMAYFILMVDSHEGSYATDIAPQLGMESTSLSRTITALEGKKLIIRIPDKEDKRRIRIKLTAKGKTQKELAKAIVRNFNQDVEARLGKKRTLEFFSIIDEIIGVAELRSKEIRNK